MAAAHGFKPAFGHTEPRRGAEWWGMSVLLTFALFKSEPPSGRNPKWPLPQKRICTQPNPTSRPAQRPPSGASPLPQLIAFQIQSQKKTPTLRLTFFMQRLRHHCGFLRPKPGR
ncbi:hypothetical protein CUU62_17650 [Pseudomonas sp. WP001]|nr:hypothetical protein CUU62_17650 [Pseudomonas sp. WP001]